EVRCRCPKSLGGGVHVLMQLSLLVDYLLAAFVLVSSCFAPRSSSILQIGRNTAVKSDADSLLGEICNTIKRTLIVNDIIFSVDILLFKADLPARALATKHVHHNGYYACLKCIKRRVWCEKGRIVTYPYNQNSSSLRTSPHINVCATLVLHENKCHQGIILV
ncbi:unnamed protein product, partial [Adineta steineri]